MLEAKPLKYKQLPGISEKQLNEHHDVLYAGYVKKYNEPIIPESNELTKYGFSNSSVGPTGFSIQASNDAKKYGTLRALEYDGKTFKQSGSSFTNIDPVANDQSRLSWLIKIALHTNDEIDSILINNLDNKKQAIEDLIKYLDYKVQRDYVKL